MNYFSIDAIIVYAFLLITLVVGLWAGRNVKTIQEYAIANRAYGTGVLSMTMLATYLTGSQAIGYAGYVFDNGVFFPLITRVFCGVIICFLFIARYITPKIHQFIGCLTMAEVMGQLYGQKARIWIGALGTLYSLIMVTLQIIWLGYIGEFINIPSQWSIFLGGVFLMMYASRGGMKAIAITDVLQFIAVTVLVPLAANVLLNKFEGIKDVFTHVPSKNFNFFQHLNAKEFWVPFIWYLFPAFPLSFPFMQRMLMARDTKQIANSQYISIFYLTIFYILLTLVGLAAIALKTMGDVNMPQEGSKVFIYLVKTYFPVGIKGTVGIGLIAAVMSTADSFLHSAGILVAHDVIKPLLKTRRHTVNILKISQYATFFLGLIALCIALNYQVLPRILYGNIHWGKGINILRDFVAIVFTIPLIAGIMGLKTDARSFFTPLVATGITFFISRLFLPDSWFMPVTIVINLVSFLGTHFVQNKGFSLIHRMYTIMEVNTCWNPSLKSLCSNVLLTPIRWLESSIQNSILPAPNYTLFAFFITLNYMIPLLLQPHVNTNFYTWSLAVRTVGAMLCIGLLLKPYWPKWLDKHLAAYWFITLLYCLPFSTTIMFILERGSMEGVIHIVLSTMMLMFLVNWTNFFILSSLGIALACLLCKQGGYQLNLINLDFNIKYSLAYQLIFMLIIGKLFLRKQGGTIKHQPFIPAHFVGTFLNEQMEFITRATQRLASHLDFYMRNTEKTWRDTDDGFYTIYSYGMQTIEDPDLFELLIEVLPSIKAMRDESKAAVLLLRQSVKTRFMAENLRMHTIKGYIKNGIFELNIHPPSYSCMIYQIIYQDSYEPTLRIVKITPDDNLLHIRDYSKVLSQEETLPLLKAFTATGDGGHNINTSKPYFEAIHRRIDDIRDGYATYTLEFPNMELVA